MTFVKLNRSTKIIFHNVSKAHYYEFREIYKGSIEEQRCRQNGRQGWSLRLDQPWNSELRWQVTNKWSKQVIQV